MISFPPYGVFARIYRDSVDPNALAPVVWRPDLPTAEREKTWLDWRYQTVELITSTLWPMWDDASSTWKNGDSSKMMALTLADFGLFDMIHQDGVFDRQPVSPVAAASIPTHRQYFVDEDTSKLADRYHFYDTTLPSAQLEKVLPDLRRSLSEKTSSLSIQVKQLIQRPRAYQVAKMLNREHRFELALTSMTSSMSSGHCFQGCFISAGIYESWLLRGFHPTAEQTTALGQFGVDIGDRRVFAGAHYPSDNLASWMMALRLVREVSSDERVHQFLSKSILEQSYVFKLLDSSSHPRYAEALDTVKSLAKA